jgi:subtilisin family serine protease
MALACSVALGGWAAPAGAVAVAPEQVAARAETQQLQVDRLAGQTERVSLLVFVEPGADRTALRAFTAQQHGRVHYEYTTVMPNAVNLRDMPANALSGLESVPGVARVVPDVFHPHLVKLDESTPRIRGLHSQVTGAGYGADGSGVRVCVADTGIDMDHIMYADRIDVAASYDFANNDSDPNDDHGHGSHVAGIAVGGTGLSVNFDPACDGDEPFQGVAPEATLIGVKILNSQGGGSDSDIIAGIDHCADQSASGGRADVINLSIGTGAYSGFCDSHLWAVAANNAVAAGVVVVAASGNEGNANAMGSPACASGVIAVGATYKADYPRCEDTQNSFQWCLDWLCFDTCTDNSPNADDLACFSNNSDNLDVAAPGSIIWSASTAAGGSSITEMSGTSQASPQVAGLAALILSQDPGLTPAEVRQIIRDGALDLGPNGFDPGYGYGRIDVLNSLALVGPQCAINADCDDSDPCTTDACNAGNCSNTPIECPPSEECVGGSCVPMVCNQNGSCDAGEDCNNCPSDCISGATSGAVCGNGVCEAGDGEDCVSCPADCNGTQNGRPSGRFCCGDGDGQNPVGCSDPRCSTGGWECTDLPSDPASYCCGDLLCEGAEDSTNCALDCGPPPYCGDGSCDPGEDSCSCPQDCGAAPGSETEFCSDGLDNDCDGQADCNDTDCQGDPSCTCLPKSSPCSQDSECCSNKCRGGACR